MARKSGDLPTALRFLIVARLGLRKTSSEVASELEIARSTGGTHRDRYAEEGVAGLYDKRRNNGLAGPPCQRHPQPPLQDHEGPARQRARVARGLRLAPRHGRRSDYQSRSMMLFEDHGR
ncbi:MAG: helix-turn-helix domain-containing protein [Byssovorax sp.]